MVVDACRECGGTVLPLMRLEPLLVALSEGARRPSTDIGLEPTLDAGPEAVDCPLCARSMGRGTYLEQGLVTIDRCTGCMVMFADDGELEAMVVQRLRSEAQRGETQRTRDGVLGQMEWRGLVD